MNKLKDDGFRQHLFNYFIVPESEVLSHFHRGGVQNPCPCLFQILSSLVCWCKAASFILKEQQRSTPVIRSLSSAGSLPLLVFYEETCEYTPGQTWASGQSHLKTPNGTGKVSDRVEVTVNEGSGMRTHLSLGILISLPLWSLSLFQMCLF